MVSYYGQLQKFIIIYYVPKTAIKRHVISTSFICSSYLGMYAYIPKLVYKQYFGGIKNEVFLKNELFFQDPEGVN